MVAQAHPNIALIKYWGKRDARLNLPAVGSLSITLSQLETCTRIARHAAAPDDCVYIDELLLDGAPAETELRTRLQTLANQMWRNNGPPPVLAIDTHNNFPTAAGLASSASGYAALVTGLDSILDCHYDDSELSTFARIGSGSAARSLYGGFVLMDKGLQEDGSDAIARPLLGADEWPLDVVIAVTSTTSKQTSSTDGMERTRATSPFFPAWCAGQETDLAAASSAVRARDFDQLADLSEYSCLKMHGLMMAAQPGLLYWNAATLACLHEIRALRNRGVGVFFTVDAGPQVKAICAPGEGDAVAAILGEIDGVITLHRAGLGEGARVVAAR
ncbi:MAG: diphosphomevalonate decarboxylase [Gammaproteobacteria bacterium]|nr:diphosphomevalonate decarboxylase [Gammaproteobacteria bacterium]